ncbi:MAG TPA: AAA family ATPase [Thermoanaerobaculia bacterium]
MRAGKTRPAALSISVLDFLAMDFPPRRWLVEGLIQERDITMLHAWRGVGKTHFVGHLAWAVASGAQFLRYTVPQPAGVLLVDGEMPQEDLQSRFAVCSDIYGEELPAPLRLLCADALPDGIPSLATSEGQALIEGELDALPDVRLLILDSVSTLCNGDLAENEAESWTVMQNWLLKLRRRGVSPLIVHHDGKGGKQRGTSKREDVISQSIHLKRPDDYNPVQGARFQVILEKARGVYGSDAEPFEARLVEEPDGRVSWELKGIEIASPDKLLERLQNGVPILEAFQDLGISRATAYRLQKKWREEGKLKPRE